jgi:dihydropteroate synthase
MIWKTRRKSMDLTRRGRIMGILNVTPDSFSDGGCHVEGGRALARARQMISEGADIIDVGGESTRPGALPVSADLEIERTAGVIHGIRASWDGWISIDTTKAEVASAALAAGADIVNDVSGLLADPAMAGVCAEAGCAVVVMHMQGNPRTMQQAPHYDDVVAEVAGFFRERHQSLLDSGIAPESLCYDPGIGFGKTLEHNLQLLRNLPELAIDGRPLMLGVSRKSFIGRALGCDGIESREWPTVALTARTRCQRVMIHRVHQVKPNVQALRMIEAIFGERA